jgi:hypothetical protein
MKWLAVWVTFSCVVVPVWASLGARFREAKRWTVYDGNRLAESSLWLVGRSGSLASNRTTSQPTRLRIVFNPHRS